MANGEFKKKKALQEQARLRRQSKRRLASQSDGIFGEGDITDEMVAHDQQRSLADQISSFLPVPNIRRIRTTGFMSFQKRVERRRLPKDETSFPPPWMDSWSTTRGRRSSSHSLAHPKPKEACLIDELCSFAAYVDLTHVEKQCREVTISNIVEIVAFKCPNASLQIFGSYRSNLSTFQSDIDLSIFDGKMAGTEQLIHKMVLEPISTKSIQPRGMSVTEVEDGGTGKEGEVDEIKGEGEETKRWW